MRKSDLNVYPTITMWSAKASIYMLCISAWMCVLFPLKTYVMKEDV